jgi:hypothetical protein
MDLDNQGEYYREFHPSLPYSMGAGAGLDIAQVRYSIIFWSFQKLPFSKLEKELWDHLITAREKMKNWNADYLMKNGRKISISTARS